MEKTGVLLRRAAALILAALLLCTGGLAAPDYLIPGGNAVGIELATQGLLVVSVEDGSGAAEAGVRKGDSIIRAGGAAVENVEALRSAAGREKTVALTVLRDGREAEYLVTPQGGQLGLQVRERVAGIGTITYIDPATGRYGALGHGVNELGTVRLLPVRTGILVPASVRAVRKGVRGTPGELKGEFDAADCIGTVENNTEYGIFGVLKQIPRRAAVPVGTAAEEGPAAILANVDGTEIREYAVRIDRVTADAANGRNLLLTVTDPALLEQTGGIVQGMSGSPILQGGKLIGAVTHVLVNHPEQGYGILIGNMLRAAA